jgi:uncharacterized protein YndB with AHSA1/START domain
VEWRTEPPLAVGWRLAFARFLRRRLEYTYEVREYVPGERLVMSTDQGPFPMGTTYTWTELPGGGTRMTLRNRGEPAGFSKIAAPLMAAAVRARESEGPRPAGRAIARATVSVVRLRPRS